MKYEQTYIPPQHRDPLIWRLAHMACVALFCTMVIGFFIAAMWMAQMIKEDGGIEAFFGVENASN